MRTDGCASRLAIRSSIHAWCRTCLPFSVDRSRKVLVMAAILSMPECQRVLSDLDDVAWATMNHCQGSADDVPRLMWTIFSEDGDTAANAESTLWNNISYQGSIFEPTIHVARYVTRAVPFVRHDEHRARVVDWLTICALGYTMTEGQGLLQWVGEDNPERPEVEAQYDRECGWVADIERTVWKAYSDVRAWLESSNDERVQLKLPYLLVALFNKAAQGAPEAINVSAEAGRISATLDDLAWATNSHRVQAGHAFALGGLQRLVPENVARLQRFLEAGDPPARAIAAQHLATTSPIRKVAFAIACALGERKHHDEWFPYESGWPWRFGHYRFDLIQAACDAQFSDEDFSEILDVLLDVVRCDAGQWTFERDVAPILQRVLGERTVDDSTTRGDIGERALRVLDAYMANPEAFSRKIGNTDNAMRPFGLKNDEQFWERLLRPVPT